MADIREFAESLVANTSGKVGILNNMLQDIYCSPRTCGSKNGRQMSKEIAKRRKKNKLKNKQRR